MKNTTIDSIEQRLKRLEAAVFGKREMKQVGGRKPDYSGATGGVRFLISKGHFKKKLGLGEVIAALAEHEYHYSKQAVHEALNRLAGKGGLLVALKEGGKKIYVKRK